MNRTEILKRLEAEGWKQGGGKGDHRKFKHPEERTVPHPRKDLAIGTLRNIYRQAGWDWRVVRAFSAAAEKMRRTH